jgi:hypothetical protein
LCLYNLTPKRYKFLICKSISSLPSVKIEVFQTFAKTRDYVKCDIIPYLSNLFFSL